MKPLLIILFGFLIVSDALSLELSLAPGLSAKNAFLYLIALALICRNVLAGERLKIGAAGSLHLLFALLIGYALLSCLAAGLLIQYPRYDLIDAGIRLKSTLIDQLLFFLVFFHGIRTAGDARSVLAGMLLAVAFANLLTVADVSGLVNLGIIEQRDDGRVEGALGEANQYAAFIVLFLPAVLAAAAMAGGLWRLTWIGAALVCMAALVMTVSRGAFVGLVVASVAGVWIFRRQLSMERLVTWAGGALLLAAVAVLALWIEYGGLLVERLIGQSGSSDFGDVSSGRTQIWSTALERMSDSPVSLFTGFGWDVYGTMPFRYAPHNHYLGLWFNLGLPGLLCGGLLLLVAIRMAATAAMSAPAMLRPQLMAFVFGAVALSGAVFFVDLYRPWWYFWAYTGLLMRMAVSVLDGETASESVADADVGLRGAVAARPSHAVRDGYGWLAVRR